MSTPYNDAIEAAKAPMLAWAETHPLPASAWDLPMDCPLWSFGLSIFQAEFVLAWARTTATH